MCDGGEVDKEDKEVCISKKDKGNRIPRLPKDPGQVYSRLATNSYVPQAKEATSGAKGDNTVGGKTAIRMVGFVRILLPQTRRCLTRSISSFCLIPSTTGLSGGLPLLFPSRPDQPLRISHFSCPISLLWDPFSDNAYIGNLVPVSIYTT